MCKRLSPAGDEDAARTLTGISAGLEAVVKA